MSEVIKQIERILSTKSITLLLGQSQFETDLIVTLENKGSWHFFYQPALKVEAVNPERINNIKSCKLNLSEDTFLKILKGEVSQQDAYNDDLIKAQSEDLDQLLAANLIIDSLRESFV
jgi:hypothetical protein